MGKHFLRGYGDAVEAKSGTELAAWIDTIKPRFRGFAYEGAGMGCAILDGLPFGRTDNVSRLLAECGDRHIYMIYVGVGWAMARLPRFRWPSPDAFDPLLRWLVLDGYGFHQAYFHTRKCVHQQVRDTPHGWPESSSYVGRGVDQGIGRALWFVGGADAGVVARLIDRFPQPRRADLYSGVGLAATYAGGTDTEELRTLVDYAGDYQPELAVGSTFAAEARVRAGLAIAHTGTATKVLCGMPPDEAAELTRHVRPTSPTDHDVPAFEVWRQRIASEFASVGGVQR